jgi:hemerythrin-like domain-containing protein
MSAIDRLFDEHRLIAKVVDALEAFTAAGPVDCELGRHELLRLTTFFREFADLNHHEKEEEFLMPALTEAGVRWDQGVLLQIRKDHEFERYLLRTLQHAALQSGEWSVDDCRRISEISADFVGFMRTHMAREDRELLPIVRERLIGSVHEDLERKLRTFDAKREASGEAKHLGELGEELAARYAPANVPRSTTDK